MEWADSLVAFEGSGYGHVFQASFRPVYNHTYRIEATRSDGATTWADVTIPPLPPDGAYDPEVLVDPNAFTNVENGFRFVEGRVPRGHLCGACVRSDTPGGV